MMSDCQHVEWTDNGVVATPWRLRRFLGLWCAGTRMAWWQRDGLDKSEARADEPCGGVTVAGSSTPMWRRETLRWRWRPDRTTMRWRRMAQMLGPLLGRVAIHSWLQGGMAWSLLVAREKPMAGMHRRRPSRRVFWREVGHVATSGLAGVPETSRGKVWRFLQNRPRTRFREFSQNCPREDSRRTHGNIRGIASGRSKLLQVVAAVGWSSM